MSQSESKEREADGSSSKDRGEFTAASLPTSKSFLLPPQRHYVGNCWRIQESAGRKLMVHLNFLVSACLRVLDELAKFAELPES